MEVLENIDTLVADVLAPENLAWVFMLLFSSGAEIVVHT